jgi:hypothetical protein
MAAGAALALLAGPCLPALAQSSPCPILSDSAATAALGGPVQTAASSGLAPGLDSCDFVDSSGTDYVVSRQVGAFQPGEPTGALMLVLKYLPDLTDQTQAQLVALGQAGASVSVPGYDIASVPGMGDAAVWITNKTDPTAVEDSLLVERGSDVIGLGAPDAPDTQAKLNALAQAILSNS